VHIDCNSNLLYHLVALFCLWNVPSFNNLCPSSCYPPVCKAVIHLEEVVHCSRNLGPLCFLKLVTCRKVQILSTWISKNQSDNPLGTIPFTVDARAICQIYVMDQQHCHAATCSVWSLRKHRMKLCRIVSLSHHMHNWEALEWCFSNFHISS
jgi:hypothetical protein